MQREWVFEGKPDKYTWIFIDAIISNNRLSGKSYAKYGGLIKVRQRGLVSFGGTCFVKATETPFGYAIVDAIKLCVELYEGAKPLRIWTRNAAVRVYLNDYAPQWDSRFGRNSRHRMPEGKSEWISASRYKADSGIIIELVSGHYFKEEFDQVGAHLGGLEICEEQHLANVTEGRGPITRWINRSRLF